jgi:hypothetical protein
MHIELRVSAGELVDRVTILELKHGRLSAVVRAQIEGDLQRLRAVAAKAFLRCVTFANVRGRGERHRTSASSSASMRRSREAKSRGSSRSRTPRREIAARARRDDTDVQLIRAHERATWNPLGRE